jgi:hypothetical protein
VHVTSNVGANGILEDVSRISPDVLILTDDPFVISRLPDVRVTFPAGMVRRHLFRAFDELAQIAV